MPDPISAGIAAVSSIGSGLIGSSAAKKAGKAEAAAAEAGVAEQRAAREELRTLLQPYTAAGTPALNQLMAIAGIAPDATDWGAYARSNPAIMQAYESQQSSPSMAGMGGGFRGIADRLNGAAPAGIAPKTLEQFAQEYHAQNGGDLSPFTTTGMEAQQGAISGLEGSPIFQALARQGEDAILQNASATGGLRGGNVQGALGQFRPAMLNQFIEQQYGRLGGIASLGQQSAAGVGSSGITSASNIAQLLANAGSAKAGAALGQGQAWGNALGQLGQGIGAYPGGAGGLIKGIF